MTSMTIDEGPLESLIGWLHDVAAISSAERWACKSH
jgi:hypothetical protein